MNTSRLGFRSLLHVPAFPTPLMHHQLPSTVDVAHAICVRIPWWKPIPTASGQMRHRDPTEEPKSKRSLCIGAQATSSRKRFFWPHARPLPKPSVTTYLRLGRMPFLWVFEAEMLVKDMMGYIAPVGCLSTAQYRYPVVQVVVDVM